MNKREKRRQKAIQAAETRRNRIERERRDRASKVRVRGPDKAAQHQAEDQRRTQARGLDIGTRVAVIRTEHGWYDGSVTGKIIDNSGSGYVVRGDDGGTYECPRKRDVHKIFY